jgi:hypothetical protein
MKKRNNARMSAPVAYGSSSKKSRPKNGRQKMNLEPRTAELSRSNFDAAIEQFLRATDVIKDSETPSRILYMFDGERAVEVTIHFKQENIQAAETSTVH